MFTQNVLDSNLADSENAIKFWTAQAATYQTAVTAKRDAYNTYLNEHEAPSSKDVNRPADQQAALAQLQSDVTQAETRYQGALVKADEARLVSEQTKSDVGQRLSVVDQPEVPAFRQPKLKGMALTFMIFIVLGFILAIAGVVAATAFDHGLRTPLDVKRLGLRPLAAIPDAGSIPIVTGPVAVRPRRVTETPEPRRLREAPASWEVPVAAAASRTQPSLHTAVGPTRPGGPRAPRAPGAVGNSRRGGFVPGRHVPGE